MKIKNKKVIITLICILFVSVVILMLLLCQLKKNKSQDTNVSESLPQTEFETETEIESEIIDTHEGQAKSLLTGEWIDETLARKRPISIIDPETTEEVKPVLYFDEEANEVKGKCKLKPYKKYFAFEIRQSKN